ncbi:hypothetical protein Aduo_016221 [Ancylostoma duodenale]
MSLTHETECYVRNCTESNEQGPATVQSPLSLPVESAAHAVNTDSSDLPKDEDNGHQFAVRFYPRARHRPKLITHDKKQVREIAVVKPHDLTTVRNFLADIILREQKSQQKTLVSWESVQRRYQTMVTDCSASDRDLLDHYQLELGFFPEAMDEQSLEVWTGKGSIIDVFSLPEFGELECVREPLPPYGLLVMLTERQKLLPQTISIAVGTDDCEEPPNHFNLPSRSKKTKQTPAPKQETGFRPPPLIRRKQSSVATGADIHKQPASDHINEVKTSTARRAGGSTAVCDASEMSMSDSKELASIRAPEKSILQSDVDHVVRDCVEKSCSPVEAAKDSRDATASKVCESAQNSAAIAPQAEDLPNPLTFFEQTSHVKGVNMLEASSTLQVSESNAVSKCSTNREDSRSFSAKNFELPSSGSDLSFEVISSSMNQPESQRVCEQTRYPTNPFQRIADKNAGFRNSTTSCNEVLLPERIAGLDISTAPVEGQASTFEKRTRSDSAFRDENYNDDCTSRNTVQVTTADSHLPEKAAQTASSPKPVSSEQITTVTTVGMESNDNSPQESSVLDCLVFPETNEEVRRYLDFIRRAVAVHHLQRGVLPEMKDILKDLDEAVTAKWVDYVLMHIPEVSIMPYDGQQHVPLVGQFDGEYIASSLSLDDINFDDQ